MNNSNPTEPSPNKPSLDKAAHILKTIAHPLRLKILCELNRQEKTVGELAQITQTAQSNLSQHLAKLRLTGIVDCERRQQHVYYFLTREDISIFINHIETLCKNTDIANKEINR